MKLTPVDQIPKMNGYHKLQELILSLIHISEPTRH